MSYCELSSAVIKGDCNIVQRVLENGADPDEPQWEINGNTPLLVAASNGFEEIIRILFEFGCNINARTIHGETALHLAISGKKCLHSCLDLLLESGCNPNIQENIRGQTALHSFVKYLINSEDYSCKSLKILENLIKKTKIHKIDYRKRTALHYAASAHVNLSFLELLLLSNCTEIKNARGEIALHEAIETDNSHEAIRLIARNSDITLTNIYGETALHIVARKGRTSVMRTLISMNVPVNAQDLNGNTALHLITERGYDIALKLILTAKNIDVNIQNNDGLTPLHAAVESGFINVVELLLNLSNCDVDVKTKDSQTALDLAQQDYCRSHPELIEILSKKYNQRE